MVLPSTRVLFEPNSEMPDPVQSLLFRLVLSTTLPVIVEPVPPEIEIALVVVPLSLSTMLLRI